MNDLKSLKEAKIEIKEKILSGRASNQKKMDEKRQFAVHNNFRNFDKKEFENFKKAAQSRLE